MVGSIGEMSISALLLLSFAEHSHNELEAIVNSQSTLVLKLREECRRLAGQLEEVTRKYRSVSGILYLSLSYHGFFLPGVTTRN